MNTVTVVNATQRLYRVYAVGVWQEVERRSLPKQYTAELNFDVLIWKRSQEHGRYTTLLEQWVKDIERRHPIPSKMGWIYAGVL